MRITESIAFKWVEMILVFIGLPLLYFYNHIPVHKAIPLLIVFFVFVSVLVRDTSFDNKAFGLNGFSGWRAIFLRFFAFALITILSILIFQRDFLFILPREQRNLWLLIIVFYPIWSAYPQEIIFRGYFFHRYKDLIKNEYLFVAVNAVLFSFSHIIFRNWLAIILTLIGGVLFALTYKKSKSTLVVFIEHMLYGNWIFTVGIGQYFYSAIPGG